MNLSLILALILAAILGLGGAGAAGYAKGKTDAERVAKIAMDEHLIADREEETKAKININVVALQGVWGRKRRTTKHSIDQTTTPLRFT